MMSASSDSQNHYRIVLHMDIDLPTLAEAVSLCRHARRAADEMASMHARHIAHQNFRLRNPSSR